MYESYRTVHDLPGLITSNPVPATAGDLTAVPPVNGEIRASDAALYRATNVTATTVTWVNIPFAAFTLVTTADTSQKPKKEKIKKPAKKEEKKTQE